MSAREADILGHQPRIAPVPEGARSAEQAALIDRVKPPAQVQAKAGANSTQWVEILIHHPDLLVAQMAMAQQFMAHGLLPPRDRELAILRLAWITQSPFEWGGHVPIGKACGLDEADIAGIIDGPDCGQWAEYEQALLNAVDELNGQAMITDATWAILSRHLDAAQLIELVQLIGFYTMVAFYQNALRMDLPEGNDGLSAR